jgi:hypothetical protein
MSVNSRFLNFVNVLSCIPGAIGSANIGTIERTTGVRDTESERCARRVMSMLMPRKRFPLLSRPSPGISPIPQGAEDGGTATSRGGTFTDNLSATSMYAECQLTLTFFATASPKPAAFVVYARRRLPEHWDGPPVRIGPRRVGWLSTEVFQWIRKKANSSPPMQFGYACLWQREVIKPCK